MIIKMNLLKKLTSNIKFSNIIFSDNNRTIKISSTVLESIFKYIQKTDKALEAGGILLGREDKETNNLIIDSCTPPFPNDKRSKYSFYRIDKKHIVEYEKLNSNNENIYLYIGEWHTHPELEPSFSKIDYNNWININKEDNCYDFQYQIIAGIEKIRIWKVEEDKKIIKVYDKFWNDLMGEEI